MKFIVGVTAGGLVRILSCPKTKSGAQSKIRAYQTGCNKYGMGADPWLFTRSFVEESHLTEVAEELMALGSTSEHFKPYLKDNGTFWAQKEPEISTFDPNWDTGRWR